MARPADAYPVTTQSGNQIRLDAVSIKALDSITFDATTGSALDTAMFEVDGLYVLLASADCIVDFTAVATKTPVNAKAVVLQAGERATVMLPVTATGFSAIGLSASGTLYIQRLTTWAGLADSVTLGNQ